MRNTDFAGIYPGLNSAQIGLRLYAIRCIAHRLRKFGFEDGINLLTPSDLIVLSSYMAGDQRAEIKAEALERLGALV